MTAGLPARTLRAQGSHEPRRVRQPSLRADQRPPRCRRRAAALGVPVPVSIATPGGERRWWTFLL